MDSAQSWRVVNEDPTESYVGLDDEFLQETTNVKLDNIRNLSVDRINHNTDSKSNSLERKSNIKLSVLSAIKKTSGSIRKQRSTNQVINDIERKVSSPMLQHAVSAFFNADKV